MLDEDTLQDRFAAAAFTGGEPFGVPVPAGADEPAGAGKYCR